MTAPKVAPPVPAPLGPGITVVLAAAAVVAVVVWLNRHLEGGPPPGARPEPMPYDDAGDDDGAEVIYMEEASGG